MADIVAFPKAYRPRCLVLTVLSTPDELTFLLNDLPIEGERLLSFLTPLFGYAQDCVMQACDDEAVCIGYEPAIPVCSMSTRFIIDGAHWVAGALGIDPALLTAA